jgi:4-amino-4-deoxy-L-arabinose transferase-like glycosyltransferase
VLTSGVSLMPDEAQYFTWSTCLDLGYYSKPPGIAWQIFLGTSLFGTTELGVRLVSILLPIAMALLIEKITKVITEGSLSYLTATAFILSPLGMSASIFATTDGGMLVWALLGTYVYLKGGSSRYMLLGLCLGAGALWKWMIYSLLIPFILHEVFVLRKGPKDILTTCSISLLGLLPSLTWNIEHSFATFRHVGGTIVRMQHIPLETFYPFFLPVLHFSLPDSSSFPFPRSSDLGSSLTPNCYKLLYGVYGEDLALHHAFAKYREIGLCWDRS